MAKAKPLAASPPTPILPDRVHELLGLPAPFDPPPPPPPWPGTLTVWDPGISIIGLKKSARSLFFPMDWYDAHPFAKTTDLRGWKQLRLTPLLPGQPFAAQEAKLAKCDRSSAARELVTVIVVQFLATGGRPPLPGRLRTREVYDDGKRVCVGFGPLGFDLSYARDHEARPTLGLAVVSPTAPTKREK